MFNISRAVLNVKTVVVDKMVKVTEKRRWCFEGSGREWIKKIPAVTNLTIVLVDKTSSRPPILKTSDEVDSVFCVQPTLQLMRCTLDFDRLVPIILRLMAKYKSALGYQYQSRSISNSPMTARSAPLTASAQKMLHVCVGLFRSRWNFGVMMWHWSRDRVWVWRGAKNTRLHHRNHGDQLNGLHQFWMSTLHLSVWHFTVVLVSW